MPEEFKFLVVWSTESIENRFKLKLRTTPFDDV